MALGGDQRSLRSKRLFQMTHAVLQFLYFRKLKQHV
jgi:hypothetical protein